jgi:hypothetical protein
MAACASSAPAAPKVNVEGSSLGCAAGDHGIQEPHLPWTFCYPASWRYNERVQPTTEPAGFDTAFDITDIADGEDKGKFGFMLVGTYDRQGAGSLAEWAIRHAATGGDLQPATWGDAQQAARLSRSGDLLALTPHYVVRLATRSGAGNLDLNSQVNGRLSTWKFVY